jgi:predicted anti-sigma-YlaC factor YlaD
MIQNANHVSCAAFQAQLAELIGSGESIARNPHIQSCENCRALLADLETIAEVVRELFPLVEPADALWEQIESAIEHERAAPGRG